MEATNQSHHESPSTAINGWAMLLVWVLTFLGGVVLIVSGFSHPQVPLLVLLGVLTMAFSVFMLTGLTILQPNTAGVFILFGSYKGSLRRSGFFWRNPLLKVETVSLKARNLNGDKLKVNDKKGNPIEIATVVVWRVLDTAQALFDVEDYEQYVAIQSESALRHLASSYAYDRDDHNEETLLASGDIVSQALQKELQARLSKAGVVVEEARLTHLAYSPEIAQVMLRRQQAEAIIAARTKIVQGAVGMVEMALDEISQKDLVQLDDERKASMVSNLLVVLCSESETNPVINTGTLYS